MPAVDPARYKDRFGEEHTSIQNDGKKLMMVVRGIEFQGNDWDMFEPTDPSSLTERRFTLHHGRLCSCTIEAEMPIPIKAADHLEYGVLKVELTLGDPSPNGGLDQESLQLSLKVGNRVRSSTGQSGWFEDEMLDVQRQLPSGMLMKACINCAFSDYGPGGHGLFGGLACFRDNKDGYRAVTSKQELFRVWETMTEFVQETYLCPEFEKREPGTGYRG
jgi:hypothetical protein